LGASGPGSIPGIFWPKSLVWTNTQHFLARLSSMDKHTAFFGQTLFYGQTHSIFLARIISYLLNKSEFIPKA